MKIPNTLSRDDAQRFLMRVGFATGPLPYPQLREALTIVARHCDYQIFGICANDAATAVQTLAQYTAALVIEPPPPLTPIEGAVYLKYNPKTDLCYIDSYPGSDRGVLVSCQSAYDTGIRDLYGHLPLDLFADVAT